MERDGLDLLRSLGFTDVTPLSHGAWPPPGAPGAVPPRSAGGPRAGAGDPRDALARVLPALAAAVELVGTYRRGGRAHLAYRVRGTERLLGGGPPEAHPVLSEEWETLEWTVPRALSRLYAVHDGLGPIDGPRAHLWVDAILPSSELFPLTRKMRFGEEGILYRPGDLLLFSPDGRGGGQCFHRPPPSPDAVAPDAAPDADPPTRAWDVGSRRLGPRVPFETFVEQLARRWCEGGGPRGSAS